MPTTTYSVLSDQLVLTAAILYALAMVAFAVESLTWKQRTGEPEVIPALVADGHGDPSVPSAGVLPLEGTSVGGSVVRGSTAQTRSVTAVASPSAGPPHEAHGVGGSRWARRAERTGMVLAAAGWVAHLGSVTARGLAAGRVPWGNMYEFSSAICLSAVAVFLAVQWGRPSRRLGLYVMLTVLVGLGLATTVLYVPAGPLVPALHSYWITIHVTAAILASGLFTIGSVLAGLQLLASRPGSSPGWGSASDRGAVRVDEGWGGRADRVRRGLPAAEDLEELCFRLLAVAFPIWTFAVIAGAIWAESAWGRYWGWDPKETWAFITWVVYAAYLHARVTAGWRGRRAAVLALVGGAAFVFNYFGVNLWIVGLHSYAGTR